MTSNDIESIRDLIDDTIRAMKNGESVNDILNSALNQTKLDDCVFSKEDINANRRLIFKLV